MKKHIFLASLGVLALAACQTQQDMLQSQQGMAVQTALNRARFDMNCPSATGQVLSTNVSQPQIQGRFASAYGVQRLEYTVGVTGCGNAERTSSFAHKAGPVALLLKRCNQHRDRLQTVCSPLPLPCLKLVRL